MSVEYEYTIVPVPLSGEWCCRLAELENDRDVAHGHLVDGPTLDALEQLDRDFSKHVARDLLFGHGPA